MEQRFFFSQMFGEPTESTAVTESDTLSAVEFDRSGDHIAVGDKTGRIIIFRSCDGIEGNENEFNYLCEFQAHETEFDYLRSQEIEEKVNKVK